MNSTGVWVAATPTGRFAIIDFGNNGGQRPVPQKSLQPGRGPEAGGNGRLLLGQ